MIDFFHDSLYQFMAQEDDECAIQEFHDDLEVEWQKEKYDEWKPLHPEGTMNEFYEELYPDEESNPEFEAKFEEIFKDTDFYRKGYRL